MFFGDYGSNKYISPGYGNVTAETISGKVITLERVHLIPDASSNIISASQGYGSLIDKVGINLVSDKEVVGHCEDSGHYVVPLK